MTGNLSANARGSLYMVLGSLGYVVNDALIRIATEEGLDVYQALLFRGLAMSLLFLVAAGKRGERLRLEDLRAPLVVRVVSELLGTALFFAGLIQLEFANAQTILLLVPFAVTVTAALHLGEVVSTRQYVTVLVGFVGVLAVVRPATDAFSVWSIAIVGSAAFLVVREFATRRVPADTPALAIALITAVSLSILTGFISVFTGWGDITPMGLALVALASVCLVVGYIFSIQTVRVGDLSVSAPFRYTALVGAVLIGIVLFDEIPDALTIGGCLLIVLAGIYSIHLENSRRIDQPVPTVDERTAGSSSGL